MSGMRIFLDANVLFSAAKTNGAVRQLLDWLILAGHECCVDAYVVEEARRNLALKAPQGLIVLDALLVKMPVAPAQPADAEIEATLPLPEKDRPVLAAAIRLRCAALVTGDRTHFGRHYGKMLHGVTIHSPRSMAVALL
jgi:predicted nucleic acid-binding protein